MLHERGLIAATDGNISVRLNESSILATPTRASMMLDSLVVGKRPPPTALPDVRAVLTIVDILGHTSGGKFWRERRGNASVGKVSYF